MKSAKQRNLRQQRSCKAKSERRAARISHQESVGLNPLRFGSEELQERFNQVVPFAFLFIQFVPNYANYLGLLKEFGPEAGLAILTCPKFWDLLQSSYSRSEAARLTLLHLDSKLRAGEGSGLTTGW